MSTGDTHASESPDSTAPSVSPISDTAETTYRRARRLNVVLGVIVAFLTIVVAAQLVPGPGPTTASSPSGTDTSTQSARGAEELGFVRRDPEDAMAIGAIDAPVVLTQWTDLRCPFCALFSRDTLPALIEDYVDTGKIRIEFHDVAFFGEQSEDAAVAARAAAQQGKFVEYVTAVYDAAPERSHPDLPREKLIAFAEQAGVPDIARFTSDLDDPQIRSAVQESTRTAQQLGVTSVPFFVAGDRAVAGAQPLKVFRSFLDSALDGAE